MAQKRKFVSDYVSGHDAAEYSELLRVLRQELRAYYELPEDLPHLILTLLMALNDQGENALPLALEVPLKLEDRGLNNWPAAKRIIPRRANSPYTEL